MESRRTAQTHEKSLILSVVNKSLLSYALPSIAGMLIVGFQTIIDGLFVGQGVGAVGLAAVNISMPLISSMLSVIIMIVSGGVVITGIAKGNNDQQKVKGYTTLTLAILLASVALMSLTVGLFLDKICLLLGSNDEVFPYVKTYMGIIGCGFIFYCIPYFTEAFTRLVGRPKMVFVSGFICFAVNIVLDWIFVMRLGWGVKGAAIATCIANSSAALVLLPNVQFGRLAGGWHEICKIFYNGSSEMLTSVSAAVTTFIFNIVIMRQLGTTGVAAFTIVCYLNFIVNMSIFGLSQAMYPLISYQLGARNSKNIKSLFRSALLIGGSIGIGVYLLVLIFKHPIAAAFSGNDVTLYEITLVATNYITLHYLFSFINIVCGSFHTAVQRPAESVVIALCRSIVFVLAAMFVLTRFIGTLGIWLSMPVAEVATLLVSLPLTANTIKIKLK